MKLHPDGKWASAFLEWKSWAVENASDSVRQELENAPEMTPIEQMVFFALKRQEMPNGWCVTSQYGIGKYKADFVVEAHPFIFCLKPRSTFYGKIVIECDGHDYHEKTKEQASHDKKRDRHMQALGYKVFRFTGSEIVKTSGRCVTEALGAHHGE